MNQSRFCRRVAGFRDREPALAEAEGVLSATDILASIAVYRSRMR
ncbi:hypothetical protein [Rhizobium binxianense]